MFNTSRRRSFFAVGAMALAGAMALGGCAATEEAAPKSSFDPNAKATLSFVWWGNDDRAARYDEAIKAFNEEFPNITVNGTFTDFPSFWEKRQTEAAGGALPDVMQFDYSKVRQYGDNGLLLDLTPFFGNEIKTDGFEKDTLALGQLDKANYAISTGSNAWALFQNLDLLTKVGAEPYPGGGTWKELNEYLGSVTEKGGGVYGGTDYTQRIQNFELTLRQNGKELFEDDGSVGFTEKDLKSFWQSGSDLRDGVAVPQQKLEEINPVSGFGGNLTTSEFTWSNFLGGLYADSGVQKISLVAPPTDKPAANDLYLKPTLMHSIAKNTKHPEAAAVFVNFLINSPKVGAIFEDSRGIPSSETVREGAALSGNAADVEKYLDSIKDRLGAAPSLPGENYGSLEQTFWDLGKSLGLKAVTVDDAVKQFFDEVSALG